MNLPIDPSPPRRTRRIPDDSMLFAWVVPALFVLFALLLIVIVLFAVGVLTGIIHYR